MKIPSFAMTLLAVVLVFYLLIVGEALLLPLVIAIAIWYLINTLAAMFGRLHLSERELPRSICLGLSFLTFALTLWGIGGFLGGRLEEVMQVIPVYQVNLTTRLENLPFLDMAAYQERGLMQMVTEWINLPAYAASIASSFAGILASGGLISIYVLFLFLEQGKFDEKISALFGAGGQEGDVRKIIDRVRNDIQKYISIKMFTSSLTGLLSYLFLRAVDVDFAGVWGLV
ncbi:MAG: AI-2E family transporter, partial [OM182 bacterium]|nr:AI-2E family transporter [OM182 bacterium]